MTKHIGSNDIENYRKIVEVTNAFRKNYSETQPLRKSKSYKHKDFIGPYFDKSINRNVSGSGLLPKYKIARKDIGKSTELLTFDFQFFWFQRTQLK